MTSSAPEVIPESAVAISSNDISVDGIGYFDQKNREFVLNTPLAPRPWKNILWNMGYNAQPTHCSGGISYSREPTDGQITLLNWSGNKYIYLQNTDTGELFNPGYAPLCDDSYHSFEHRIGLNTSKTMLEQYGLQVEVTQSVDATHPREYFEIRVHNIRNAISQWRIVFLCELNLSMGDGKFGATDVFRARHSTDCRVIETTNLLDSTGQHTAWLEASEPLNGHLFDQTDFTGAYGSRARPQSLLKQWPDDHSPIESPILAGFIDCVFKPGTERQMHFTLGLGQRVTTDDQRVTRSDIANSRDQQSAWQNELYSRIEVETPDAEFDLFVNTWIKHQLTYCAYWNRGWGKGFRDSNQDAWAFTLLDASRSREMILDCLPYQYPDGRTVRRWAPIVRDQYNDGGAWLIFATHAYIAESGDVDVLQHEAPFFESDQRGTTYEHLKRAVDYLWEHRGDRGLCLMPFGDWNDRLTGVGREGRGQSVWTSMALVESFAKMIEIATLCDAKQDAKAFASRHAELISIIRREAWTGQWYSRAFTDAGAPVGAPTNEHGSIYVLPQAWSMLSGIATQEQTPHIVQAVRERLECAHGFRLLTPPYQNYDPAIGHLSATPPGTLENGGNYCHGTMFMAYALCMTKQVDYGLDIFKRILPTNPNNPPGVSRQEPFSLTNSYAAPESGDRAGRSLFSWRTGAAGWAFRCAIEGILGVKAVIGGLQISGDLPTDWPHAKLTRTYRGRKLVIHWRRTGQTSRTLNGIPINDDPICTESLSDEINVLEITL
ncbi:GH36-type glycosyl hydrolase domain-containing protein [Cerasicoccus fimbriatus]|uniref:GH36-type glycosyl hydrolase domain-containing protein n=1 Tax=Cerasicoccus fimbriatus TaxID=3014554 RepID=UPI0022B34802|nr:hypothetical protein [Cerasicoccus sp. TK19100]